MREKAYLGGLVMCILCKVHWEGGHIGWEWCSTVLIYIVSLGVLSFSDIPAGIVLLQLHWLQLVCQEAILMHINLAIYVCINVMCMLASSPERGYVYVCVCTRWGNWLCSAVANACCSSGSYVMSVASFSSSTQQGIEHGWTTGTDDHWHTNS